MPRTIAATLPLPLLSPAIASAGMDERRVLGAGRDEPRVSERGVPAGRELVGLGLDDAAAFSTGFLASGVETIILSILALAQTLLMKTF
jgi:hypothetical protein